MTPEKVSAPACEPTGRLRVADEMGEGEWGGTARCSCTKPIHSCHSAAASSTGHDVPHGEALIKKPGLSA